MPPRSRPPDQVPAGAPRYWTQTDVARRFGVGRYQLVLWMTRQPDHPAPDAVVDGAPVWEITRGEQWDAWHLRLFSAAALPHYVGPATIARHCGVGRSTVSNWLARWPEAVPQPDAIVDDGRPLWLASRLPEWVLWAGVHATNAGGAR